MHRIRTIIAVLGLLATAPLAAQPYAFVSLSDGAFDGMRVIDLTSMTVERTLTGLGDEPGRMVANADRSRIYLSSWRFANPQNQGLIYVIDTRLRQVVAGPVVVGLKQNRTIGISPDGMRVYTWKLESVNGVTSIGVVVLDAITLAEIATVPITGANCIATATNVAVSPDGRIVATVCTDGVRIIDPVTFAVTLGGLPTVGNARILGFSPDGGEVYVSGLGPVNFTNTGIRAIDLTTGAGNDFSWNLGVGGNLAISSGAQAFRMHTVRRPSDPPDDPTVYFSYFAAGANNPVAWASGSALVARQRTLIGRGAAGPGSSIGISPDGTVGLTARIGGVQRVVTEPASDPLLRIAPSGSILAQTGVASFTDIIVVPYPPDFVFQNGFEE